MIPFLKSFAFAAKGLKDLFRHHRNARIHLVAAITAIVLGFIFHISIGEWVAVLLSIGVVIALEGMNTAIEYLTDMVSPGIHPMAGKVKDMAAGAVLFAVLCAVAIGIIIFSPKMIHWLNG
jgi:diacylglycerol kinase (ATP)